MFLARNEAFHTRTQSAQVKVLLMTDGMEQAVLLDSRKCIFRQKNLRLIYIKSALRLLYMAPAKPSYVNK